MLFCTISILLLAIGGILALMYCNARWQFDRSVRRLFADCGNSDKIFSHSQIEGLPAPVQRYFKRVLKEGQPYINCVRLQHNGKFRTGPNKKWSLIKGEEYFVTAKPGFIWKGQTSMFTAEDSFFSGAGKLKVWLFSVLPIVNGHGIKYTQGELLRWLGEAVWFPTALLPGDCLHWTPIDDQNALLDFRYNEFHCFYTVTFNAIGEIVQIETKRYRSGNQLETWIGKMGKYKEIDGVRVPAIVKAGWKPEEQLFNYAIFRIHKIEFNQRKKF